MSQSPEEKFGAPEPAKSTMTLPASDAPTAEASTDSMSENEKSLLAKIGEVGEETVKRLKEIFSEVDREELRKSVNRDQIQRSIASTLDTLNAKAQAFLAPKNEDGSESDAKSDPLHSETTLNTSPDAPGPVGNEAVHPDEAPRHSAVNPPENETRSFT
jgi:hypothetical protein